MLEIPARGAKVLEDLGGASDPITTFKESGYAEKVAEERGEGAGEMIVKLARASRRREA